MPRGGLAVALGLLLVAGACKTAPPDPSPRGEVSRRVLDESLALGTEFLIHNQRPDGNFNYEYDWRARRQSRGDSQVRQAGAVWGLALLYHDQPSAPVGEALRSAERFFAEHSRVADDRRFIAYPGEPEGSTGTVALIALSLVDLLRAEGGEMPPEALATYREQLAQYLRFLLAARTKDGLFHASYELERGAPKGPPSPYFDGEALLALVKAAKYLERDDLWPAAIVSADQGWLVNVERARAEDNDSNITKGYYQWSSMAYFELATSEQPDMTRFGDRVLELADWMIDVHRTLQRTRNTAYAYEGIIHAYAIADARGDVARRDKYADVIQRGLTKLTSWQLGSSIGNGYVAQADASDLLARGGVQNHAKEAPLRIDVTQHQMHAVILARRYVYKDAGAPAPAPAGPQ
ncbi:MAG: hypothetical protein H6713_12500 [Myxococcales bacterium]|nr:hypothetical protein [Myxococcales bacterium]MCB9750798.1 hypothetical protein [Myxococcales bacterium]